MAVAEMDYELRGIRLSAREVVKRFEAQLPFGDVARELVGLPALSVSAQPRLAILSPGALAKPLEVSEEDSPVDILAPDHPVLRKPNQITLADFDSWIEQRGSKFWSEWDEAYVPILATHDEDQPPQRGGWLVARYGKGYYTYFAYALHRQLLLGVPGAYRILANLLALGRTDADLDPSRENR